MVADCHTCKPQNERKEGHGATIQAIDVFGQAEDRGGLDRADLLREIARTISRDVSTMSREVKGWIGDHF